MQLSVMVAVEVFVSLSCFPKQMSSGILNYDTGWTFGRCRL